MDPFLNSGITIASGRTCDFLPHQQKYPAISLNFLLQRSEIKKAIQIGSLSSGDKTRTCDLWVMSPTSYQLLHPAIYFSDNFFIYTVLNRQTKLRVSLPIKKPEFLSKSSVFLLREDKSRTLSCKKQMVLEMHQTILEMLTQGCNSSWFNG